MSKHGSEDRSEDDEDAMRIAVLYVYRVPVVTCKCLQLEHHIIHALKNFMKYRHNDKH